MVFAGSGSLSLAAALTAGYFAFIASGQLRSSFVRPMVAVAYLLTIVFASAAIVAAFDSDDAAIALAFYELGALCTWGYLLYRKLPAARLGRRKFGGAIVQQWCWHGLIALAYISVNGALFGDPVGPATSVCLVVHATGVLFLTLQPQWQPLVRLVVTLFVAAGLKIVLYDMADFSTVEKIVAFMVIGAVLLAAAYWFQRMRMETEHGLRPLNAPRSARRCRPIAGVPARAPAPLLHRSGAGQRREEARRFGEQDCMNAGSAPGKKQNYFGAL